MKDNVGVAIFAHNRSDSLERLLGTVAAADRASDFHYTIFVDGPRSSEEEAQVARVHEVAKCFAAPNAECRFSDTNRGLRRSIYNGVSEVIDRFGAAIVLEDDLVISKSALRFFADGLDHHARDESTWTICGYLYDNGRPPRSGRPSRLPFPNPWGWATWRRAWQHFDLDAKPNHELISSKSFKTSFDLDGLYPFTRMLRLSMEGLVNSWFIHWYLASFSHGAGAIYPPSRVTDNYGFRAGTHSSSLNPYELLVRRPNLYAAGVEWPACPDVDVEMLDSLRGARELRVRRTIARWGEIKRRIKQ